MIKEKLRNVLSAAVILQIAALLFFYAYGANQPLLLQHVVAVEGAFLIATWLGGYYVICQICFPKPTPVTMKLGLIDSGGVLKSELDLAGRQSVLIGRGTAANPVDIDLSESEHPEYVDEQHAILNCIGTEWYIEAVSDAYSVGLKKNGETIAYKLKTEIPYRIDAGDFIFISYERIAVRG